MLSFKHESQRVRTIVNGFFKCYIRNTLDGSQDDMRRADLAKETQYSRSLTWHLILKMLIESGNLLILNYSELWFTSYGSRRRGWYNYYLAGGNVESNPSSSQVRAMPAHVEIVLKYIYQTATQLRQLHTSNSTKQPTKKKAKQKKTYALYNSISNIYEELKQLHNHDIIKA